MIDGNKNVFDDVRNSEKKEQETERGTKRGTLQKTDKGTKLWK